MEFVESMEGSAMSFSNAAEFGALLTDVRGRVDERLAEWLRPRLAAATAISEEVGAVAAAVNELALRGGKRMRAALVAAGYGSHAWVGVCEPAMMAVELLQTYLLIHDDWMDDDPVRRGGPSVHMLLREKLGTRTLGDAAAILAGDLASGYAQSVLLETQLPPERVLRAMQAFARTQVDVVTGQLAEMRAAVRTGPLPSVETIHALKTASYTVTGPLLLGATLAGADDARCAELERFGRPLGIAFQLRDDLLGVFGDPTATGKPVWNDIRQGKRTTLVTELRGDPRAEAVLARAFGKLDATHEDLEAVVRVMEQSGARGRVEARIRELCEEARRVLDAMSPTLSVEGRAWLGGAIAALGERSS